MTEEAIIIDKFSKWVFGRFFERLQSEKIDIIDTLLESEWSY